MPKYSSGPLKGQRNRLSDLRCAWKKAHPSEREAFLDGLRADAADKAESAPEPLWYGLPESQWAAKDAS